MATQDIITFGWAEAARALFRERGVTKGLWRIGVSLRFAAANTGPNIGSMMPSGVVAVESIVLSPADEPGPLVYDAASMVDDAKTARGKKPATTPGKRSSRQPAPRGKSTR